MKSFIGCGVTTCSLVTVRFVLEKTNYGRLSYLKMVSPEDISLFDKPEL
jgi:hypothetical protein